MARILVWFFLSDAEQCPFIWISESYYFCVKNVKPFLFHDVIEVRTICLMLQRKPVSDSQSTEVFDGTLFDYKTEKFGFVLFHLKLM